MAVRTSNNALLHFFLSPSSTAGMSYVKRLFSFDVVEVESERAGTIRAVNTPLLNLNFVQPSVKNTFSLNGQLVEIFSVPRLRKSDFPTLLGLDGIVYSMAASVIFSNLVWVVFLPLTDAFYMTLWMFLIPLLGYTCGTFSTDTVPTVFLHAILAKVIKRFRLFAFRASLHTFDYTAEEPKS